MNLVRVVASAFAVLLSSTLQAQGPFSQLVSPTRIVAPAGTLQGKIEGTAGGPAHAYLGIPYAQPPVGPLRWKPPAPPSPWAGVREATGFGSRCMQLPLYDDMIFRDPGTSEDCLTLNVWTPANVRPGAKLPVMVWIYGGGFNTGGSSEPRQDGAHLATKGVVVVSLNYRENIFGFLTHPELIAESPAHAAGNYGLMDMVAALKWVQQNIGAFGGDAANVTIFGESAGSFAVSALMASPQARGLFAKAIGESGGAFGGPDFHYDPAAQRAVRDADFARTKLHASSLAELRALPPDQLLQATRELRFGADVDGAFLPELPSAIFAAERQNDVPLLAGWNRDEGGSGKGPSVITPTGGSSAATTAGVPGDLERLRQTAAKDFGARAPQFLQAFSANTDPEALTRLQHYAAARFIAYGTWKWIEAAAAADKSPVYRYEFDLAPPPDPARPGRYGAFHSDEIEYVFGVLDSRKGIAWRAQDYAMSEQIMAWWVNFARTGDPNAAANPNAAPRWPVYSPASDARVMYLNQPTSRSEKDRNRDEFLFLTTVWK